jgi:hypothetical protein
VGGLSSGFGPSGQNPFGGGGIVGVASDSDKESIKVYNQRQKYNEWEFFALLNQTGQAPPGTPGGGQNPAANPNNPFGPTGSPFGTPTGNPIGTPTGNPFGSPTGNPFGTPAGSPFGNTPGQQFGPPGQPGQPGQPGRPGQQIQQPFGFGNPPQQQPNPPVKR